MKKQQEISNKLMSERVGQEVEVLIENISFDGKYLIGRTKQDVPDIDGLIYIKNEDEKLLNTFQKCKITDYSEYDVTGIII